MNYDSLAQQDGKAGNGNAVTDYTKPTPTPPQPQVPNKTPMHSRTQPNR